MRDGDARARDDDDDDDDDDDTAVGGFVDDMQPVRALKVVEWARALYRTDRGLATSRRTYDC